MPNELTVIEHQLKQVEPQLHNALGGLMPANRLIQTVLISCERTPRLLACSPQSIMNGAMTFACLGLPVDGATGQGFLLPFKTTAQAAIGYKGYNTLGARAGLTITGAAVREDDEIFDYLLGDKAFVKHKPKLGSKARIIAFWAAAAAHGRPPIISILSIDEVSAIKAKSPAVRANADTPWNDPTIGFPAMGEKSAKRRLARSTPLITDAQQFMLGARMEEAFDEQGRPSWITPERGVVLEGDFSPMPARERSPTPTAAQLIDASPLQPGPTAADPGASPQTSTVQNPTDEGEAPDELSSEDLQRYSEMLAAAALKGTVELQRVWKSLPFDAQAVLKTAKDTAHKPAAKLADKAMDTAS